MGRVMIALAAGVAVAVGTAFVMAVVLGILNLYLTGHSIRWPEQVRSFGPISMSLLDLVFLLAVGAAMAVTIALSLKGTGR